MSVRDRFLNANALVRFLFDGLFLSLFALIAYLCLRPGGQVSEVAVIPGFLAEWADQYPTLPHFIAFFPLALIGFFANLPARWISRFPVIGSWSALCPPKGSAETQTLFRHTWKSTGCNLLFLLAVAVIFELPQIWIPGRSATVDDVLAGWAGIGAALVVFLAGVKALGFVRPKYSVLRHQTSFNR